MLGLTTVVKLKVDMMEKDDSWRKRLVGDLIGFL
jgi:hypothetical protein